MTGIIPKECTCTISTEKGSCRYCRALAWTKQQGGQIAFDLENPDKFPARAPRIPDLARQGSYSSEGARNSPSAKRKARLTNIRKEREAHQAAKLAKRAQRPVPVLEHDREVEATLHAMDRIAGLPVDVRRRIGAYLRKRPEVHLVVVDLRHGAPAPTDTDAPPNGATEDDYMNKRPWWAR